MVFKTIKEKQKWMEQDGQSHVRIETAEAERWVYGIHDTTVYF